MNFGCPVRKVTRKGGGSAIPVKPRLLASIVRAAVKHAGSVPVTIKFRMGIDDGLLTYLDAGRIGEDEGVRAVALHARTAAQLYDGEARWDAHRRAQAGRAGPGARQRRHLGSRRRPAHDAPDRLRRRRGRARLPGPPVAVPRSGRRVRRARAARPARPRRRRRDHARPRRAGLRTGSAKRRPCAPSAATPPGTPRASAAARSCASR